MKTTISFTSLYLAPLFLSMASIASMASELPFAIAIHGGAGTIEKSQFTPEKEQAYRDKLKEAVQQVIKF